MHPTEAKTSAERQQLYVERQREKGRVRAQIWVTEEELQRIQELLIEMRRDS